MKKLNLRIWLTNLAEFFARLVFLISRIFITLTSLFLIIGGVFGIWGGSLEYLGNLITGIIFIYPFRKIVNSNLMKYFWILAINSLLYVLQSASFGPTTPWYMMWVGNFLCWLNVVAVWQYTRHKLSTSGFDPFFGIKYLVYFFGSLGLLGVTTLAVLFLDPHYSDTGKRYISLGPIGMGNKQWVEPIFDKKVFASGYHVDSSVSTPSNSMNVTIEVPMEGVGNWEMYENDKKIMQIEFDNKGVKTVTAYDDKSPWGLVSKMGLQPWRRDRKGEMHPESIIHKNELLSDYNLWIEFGYIQVEGDKNYFEEQKYDEGDWLKIKLNKYIEYPGKKSWNILPFERKKIPWELSIKQGDVITPVVSQIEIWVK